MRNPRFLPFVFSALLAGCVPGRDKTPVFDIERYLSHDNAEITFYSSRCDGLYDSALVKNNGFMKIVKLMHYDRNKAVMRAIGEGIYQKNIKLVNKCGEDV